MKTLTIRGLSDEVHGALKQRARANRRSLNQEVIAVLSNKNDISKAMNEEAACKRLKAERIIAEVDRIRSGLTGFLSVEEIDAAIDEGRNY